MDAAAVLGDPVQSGACAWVGCRDLVQARAGVRAQVFGRRWLESMRAWVRRGVEVAPLHLHGARERVCRVDESQFFRHGQTDVFIQKKNQEPTQNSAHASRTN